MSTDIAIPASIAVCLYCIGVYFHIKVINVSRRDKEMTWKLDLSNSCVLIAHQGYILIFDIISYTISDIYLHTGEWLCYFSRIFAYYGSLYTAGHSMIVSMLKYAIIVHWEMARDIGHEKIKKIFFVINLLHPSLMILLHFILAPDFAIVYDYFASVDRCLGDPKNNWGQIATEHKLNCTLSIRHFLNRKQRMT